MILDTVPFLLRKPSAAVAMLAMISALLAGCRTSSSCRCDETPPLAAKSAGIHAPSPNATSERQHDDAPSVAVRTEEPTSKSVSRSTHTDVRLVAFTTAKVPADSFPLSFEEAIATSLDRNPALITLRANEPVARAAYGVAETYPFNPTVQLQVLPYARDKAGNTLGVNNYVWLNQTLELAHQRQHREASASAFLNQVRWNIVQAELTNAAQTQRLYFAALYQRELHNLAERTTKLNDDLHGIVDRRFKAGLATAAEQTTAKIAARQSQRQEELADATYQTALLALQRQLNLQAHEPFSLVGRLEEFSWLPVPGAEAPSESPSSITVSDETVTNLAFSRPDVLAAHAGIDVARANAALARANQVQNLGIGPFFEHAEDGTYLAGFRAQGNIPVWDSGRPLTAQREAEQNLQVTTFNQLRLRARTEAQTAIERYERARRMVAHEGSDPAGTTSTELENIKKQFASGQADILNVFAAENGLLQEYRTHLDLLNEVAQSAADVTLMAGLPPACLFTNRAAAEHPEELPAPKELPAP